MKNLVSGVTRLRRRLDYVLAKLTGRNMSAIDSGIRQVCVCLVVCMYVCVCASSDTALACIFYTTFEQKARWMRVEFGSWHCYKCVASHL